MRNLSRALIEHGRIITTVEKAKEVRPFVEKLITLARKGSLHARRLALAKLPDREAVEKLFNELGPRFKDRPGGYTRVIKRHERRLGDAGKTAFLELLKAGETKVRTKKAAPPPAPAPAPRAKEVPSQEASEPETPPASEKSETPPAS